MRLPRPDAIAAASVFGLAILLLVPFVATDPARGVTFSNAPFSDEAWNLMGARNLVVFGHPATDEWRTYLLALPFTVIEAVALGLFGLDLVVARLVLIGCVAVTGAVITLGVRSLVGTAAAWLAGVAYVTSALVLYYGRLAFLEPMVAAFLAAGVVTLGAAVRGRPLAWGIAGGTFLALAVMTKAVAIAAAAPIALVVLVGARQIPWARRWLLGAVPAAGALALGWGLLLWTRQRAVEVVIGTIYPPYELPKDLNELFKRLANFPLEDAALPLTLPLLVLALAGTVRLAMRSPTLPGERLPAAAAAAGLAAAIALLSVVSYQPNRYIVAFLPLAAILAAWSVPFERLKGVPGALGRPAVIAALLAVAVAAPGVWLQSTWIRAGGDEVARIQAAAEQGLPSGITIAGQYAPLVAFTTGARTVVPFETVNDGDLYADGARAFIWIDEGPRFMVLGHPEAWAARQTMACMTWGASPARSCIYLVP